MSFGFKFINNSNQLVIDDTNVKPWLITGPYIGTGWKLIELDTTDTSNFSAGFRFNSFKNYPPNRAGVAETWRLYEVFYIAPSTVNCFAVFTLPDVTGGLWYTAGSRGTVIQAGVSPSEAIPIANNAVYPSTSIVIAVPESWLLSSTPEQQAAAIPKVYYYAADAIPNASKGTGYGIQVFKEDSTCTYDSDKKHIQPGTYSFGYVQAPAFPDNFATQGGYDVPVIPTAIGFTGNANNLAFSLTTCTYVKMKDPPGGTNLVDGWFSNIFYNRTGSTLYTANVLTATHIWEQDSDTLVSGNVYVLGSEASSTLSTTGPTSYYSRVLALDTTGFDVPYTPTQFPASYQVKAYRYDNSYYANGPITTVPEREYPPIQPSYPYTIIRFKVTAYNVVDSTLPFTISGTGITTNDIQSIYINGVFQTGVSLTGSVPISGSIGTVDLLLKEDYVIEGTETLTFSLNGNKGSASVAITEQKTYSNPYISGATTQSDGSIWVAEGGTYTIKLTTFNVTQGTVIPYKLEVVSGNFTASDIQSGSLTGNLTVGTIVTGSGEASASFTVKSDNLTESIQEKFSVSVIYPGTSVYTTIIPEVWVQDTSLDPVPTYRITYNGYTSGNIQANEGDTLTFTVVCTNVPDGTRIYPRFAPENSNMDVSDFIVPTTWYDPNASQLLGILVYNNTASFSVPIKNDLLTEGTESFVPMLSRISSLTDASDRLDTWPGTVFVYDTSRTPSTYSIAFSPTSVNEGYEFTATFTTNQYTGDTLFWTISGISLADIDTMYVIGSSGVTAHTAITKSLSGTFSFYNPSPFTYTIGVLVLGDGITEGNETATFSIRSGSETGPVLASNSITIVDWIKNVSVSLNTNAVVYPNGVILTITNGVPNGTVYWSVNNQNYDGTYTLDANGGTYGLIAQNFQPGDYTLYMKFEGPVYRQVSWTVGPQYPAAGTLYRYYCTGYDKMGQYHNGTGSYYDQLVEANSSYCGYVAPTLTVTNYSYATNDPSYIDVWTSPAASYDGLRCRGGANSSIRNNIDMYVSRTFTVNIACTITAYLHVSSEANYDWGEIYLDGVMYARGSGTYESGALTGTIGAGTHTIKVRYTKDGSIAGGTDTAFVEYYLT